MRLPFMALWAVALVCLFSACSATEESKLPPAGKSLARFEFPGRTGTLEEYLEEYRVAIVKRLEAAQDGKSSDGPTSFTANATTESAAPGDNAEITNNQESGVDEGGIVKNYGNYLLTLRQGKLRLVDVDPSHALALSDSIEVTMPGMSTDAWYDELLLHGNVAVVIGYRYYSYDPGSGSQMGTELNFFEITDEGKLARRGSWLIDSNDYFSSRNYTGRLIDGKMLIYMPYSPFSQSGATDVAYRPAYIHRISEGGRIDRVRPLYSSSSVFYPIQEISWPVIHTVLKCDLANPEELPCESVSIIAPWNREYYVANDAVYLWTGESNFSYCGVGLLEGETRAREDATLYRVSLTDLAVTAVRLNLEPADQLAFSLKTSGDAIQVFGTQFVGTVAQRLATVPLESFSTEPGMLEDSVYLTLPGSFGPHRFSTQHLVFGDRELHVVDRETFAISSTTLPFQASRLEWAGTEALAFGDEYSERGYSQSGISRVSLDGGVPTVRDTVWLGRSWQSEYRTHSYSFKDGLFALPFATTSNDSSAMRFFRLADSGEIESVGQIAEVESDDSETCSSSCYDWYGSRRTIFLEDQVLTLMKDQISRVEIGERVKVLEALEL